jgi:membrane-associated protease RseP (regulator of RpoE activity)
MPALLYGLAALVIWIVALLGYHVATLLVGRWFGIRCREIHIGIGPTVFRKAGRRCTLRVSALPLGGSTKLDDYPEATALAQMMIVLSGPVFALMVGCLILALPVWLGAHQLEACSPAESQVEPCAVPGLRLQADLANWPAQLALFRDTAVEFLIRLATFGSLDGWGGYIGYFVTAGNVGATLSVAAWFSTIGVLLVFLGTVNLLPLPTLNGFQFLLAAGRAISGREAPEGIRVALVYVGLIVMLVLFGRLVWVDVRWLWTLWF